MKTKKKLMIGIHKVLWGSDYPHHEGTWPHSASAIERTMVHLSDRERANVLGLNAARVFRFPIPARYHTQEDVAAVVTQRRT